ncbi:alpha/beta hydrolase family protein [Actinacidiphila paucisporea]|uniref:Platelet-activating factor acetylhydrolase, isoform II n=1 Tax=Actinacidiphila paucisporea TaxID=310782 RepID=A0A1M7NFE3_9ACTN|nr:hydrolase [Actinacidiphila paucisporea]SHN01963.1 Platelet-activating factor acetylhydrolase, isoform II [Actinacidiphila paucisporea]
MQTRRAAVLSAAVAALSAVPLPAVASSPAPPRPRGLGRLRLPPPSGPYAVGTVALRLVDTVRPDPWVPQPYRELMVSLRYPAQGVRPGPGAPQMLPGEAAGFAELAGYTGVPAARVDWAATRTHAHQGAPAAAGPFPLVLYSPGAGDPRSLNSTLCDDLASRGYAVLTVDHTYDAAAVEFPGGRVESTVLPAELAKVVPDPEHPDPARVAPLLRKVLDVRVADIGFVLDRLPDALPRPLRGLPDFARVGMFGQSAGGFTALQAMYGDPRIAAGANFDGVTAYVEDDADRGYLPPVAAGGLDRPFLLVGKDGNTRRTVPSWDALWRHSRGWHRGLSLAGSEHATFTDAETLIPQIARRLHLPAGTVPANLGALDPGRAVRAQRAYLVAFFDRWLRDRDDHGLLDGPSPCHREVRFFS